MFGRRRDPRQARVLTWASLRWVVRHHAWTPWYLLRYWRYFWLRVRRPGIVTEGFVFLGRGVELYARKGYGRLIIGPWVHVGDGTALRCHEGTLRVGEKVVFGQQGRVNCYLDIEIGAATLIADWLYVCDFDHRFDDLSLPIKDQGIVKSPVRVGPDVWIGARVTVLRGARVGRGCVLAAHSVVGRREIPPYSVAAGSPARVVRRRQALVEGGSGAAERGGQASVQGGSGAAERGGQASVQGGSGAAERGGQASAEGAPDQAERRRAEVEQRGVQS